MSRDSEVIQQLEKIAKAINALEGMPVEYPLAKKLHAVMVEIQAACEPAQPGESAKEGQP